MAKYTQFEEVPVWQDAARLYNDVLDLLEEREVSLSREFRSQLDRAALSISNNIAEGFERRSTKELTGYLVVARASAGEVRSMISAVYQRRSLAPLKERLVLIRQSAESCARQISGWVNSLEQSPVQGNRYHQSSRDNSSPKASENTQRPHRTAFRKD
jgi:four helix bundle protein